MHELRVNYLYIDMNSYFASVEQQVEPALRGKPVGVVTTLADNAACIAASYEAKKLGIGMGVRMREARLRCPEIVFRAARHDLYVEYHHHILRAIERVHPVENVHSIDEVSCRLLGPDMHLNRAMEIGERARQSIYDNAGMALRCSIGLGASRLQAKLASDLEKPCGMQWLLPHVLPEKIAHLELEDIPGIGRNMARRLRSAGILTIVQLFGIQPKHARRIWRSVTGERFVMELHGHDIPHMETGKSHSLGHGQVLSPLNRSAENARLVARRLLVKAATRLRRANLLASSLYVSVKSADQGRYGMHRTFAPTQDSFLLLRVFASVWSQMDPQHPLNVSVSLGNLTPAGDYIADLFSTEDRSDGQTRRERLCSLVDRLNQQFGQDTVFYGQKPVAITPYTGAKIAFGRIPGTEEFRD